MRFEPSVLAGAFLIRPELRHDERGFFARTWCATEFARHQITPRVAQCNISFNQQRGTLRGMHFQADPKPEAKLVRCTRGKLYDVIIDLRPHSKTYCRWEGFELSAENRCAVYVPEGFAHGFQTLEDETEVFYQMSEFYFSDLARGVRWNDPLFNIDWPVAEPILSDRDATYADLAR
jgi:dTDP-4-dehydrorhamnose 3,5-epimerase